MEATQPTIAERIDAIEQFLQQLVLLLEVEPEISRESISAWLQVCAASARANGIESPRRAAALDHLCVRVLNAPVEVVRPTGMWPS